MLPPLVSFVAWNRMGLTVRNLISLLKTRNDFELHIIDNNSSDDSWLFIQELNDSRIKSKTRFYTNRGPIYAVNFNLSKRKKDQYFIAVDNDVNIHTSDWITQFINAFNEFPEVGLLGAVSCDYYSRYKLPAIKWESNGINYIQICKGFIEGCCQCFRPELLEYLGYWCEENCMGDVEISYRICNYTMYNAGFLPAVEIDQLQHISCENCQGREWCRLDRNITDCFKIHNDKYRNPQFKTINGWKYQHCINEMENGKRTVYCASIHDRESINNYRYNKKLAEDNFRYYEENGN